jgi:hypothetical protein
MLTPEEINMNTDAITIIAPSLEAAMQQFAQRGLSQQGYAISSPVMRTEFTLVTKGGSDRLFGGEALFAATFTRISVAQR